ncbi:hypothetical protein Tco_0267811 [Tanacetum coccineum]
MGLFVGARVEVGVTTLIAKFLILDILIDHDSPVVVGRGFLQSDSDEEEEYQIKRNKFGAPIYGPKLAPYLNCNDPDERSLAIQITMETNDDEAGSSRSKRSRHETVEDVLLPQVYHEFFLLGGCSRDAKSRLHKAASDEEIFTSVAWIRAFNINEPIYDKLCHEFYSTYEFDKVCADDELQTKKIIKFRLDGRANSLTLLEFARRLGLYQAVELEEDGFNVYFEGGLRNDDNFNAQDYWLSISRGDNIGLSRSHTSTIRNPILRGVDKGCGEELKCSNLLYQGVFEHMAGVYSVPMQRAYNLPGYAQPQYDQYYQQYPPPPPQYQQ